MRTLVIAEPGSTHEGDFDAMLAIMAITKWADADVYKNQWVSDPQKMCDRRNAPEYFSSYQKLAYPVEWHSALQSCAHVRGLAYGCTVYLPEDAALIAPFVDYLKISSFEAADDELLSAALSAHEKVIVSVGMLADYRAILPSPRHAQMPWAVLHCCSAYPAPLASLNIAAMPFGLRPTKPGFSDHSRDVRVGAWAVCRGAEVVETHVRHLGTRPSNRDYGVSLDDSQFRDYVQNIRAAEAALGDGKKHVQVCEEPMLKYRVGV